jgi:hypothetical protein
MPLVEQQNGRGLSMNVLLLLEMDNSFVAVSG